MYDRQIYRKIIISLMIIWVCHLLLGVVFEDSSDVNEEERVSTFNQESIIKDELLLKRRLATENETEQNLTTEDTEEVGEESTWDGPVLNSYAGTIEGPSGKETYYNLPMNGVVSIMRSMGYSEEEYPYWIRDDGCKMLGPYIMCAAELGIRPKGTILETSLGTAMVCDTGTFAYYNQYQIDIATTW